MLVSTRPGPELYPSMSAFRMAPADGHGAGSTPKGLKGLFSRRSVTSPEPTSRFSRTASTKRQAVAAPSAIPEATHERNIRFVSPDLPLTRRSEDGKWQPPSLSKGSISTPTLALLKQDDAAAAATVDDVEQKQRRKGGHKHSLSVLFHAAKSGLRGQEPKAKASDLSIKVPPQAIAVQAKPSQPGSPTTGRQPLATSPASAGLRSVTSPVASSTARSPNIRHASDSHATTTSPTLRQSSSSLKSPSHAVPQAPIDSTLSKDHYHLRLSTSYIVKTLLPLMRHETSELKERERKVADERLRALARMEKNWGSDWVRAAGLLASSERPLQAASSAVGPLEAKARGIHVGDRAKERERKAWTEAMRDGILLCILINHLFPRSPPPVSRINLSEDGISRATNASRFLGACAQLGLPQDELCALEDLQLGSEQSLGRVGLTIIALARLAGPLQARRSPKTGSGFSTPTASPPASPHAVNFRISSSVASSRSTTPVQQASPLRHGQRSPTPRVLLRPRLSAPSSRYSSETAESSFLHGTDSDDVSVRPRLVLSSNTPSLVSSPSRSSAPTIWNPSSATTSDTTSPSVYTPLMETAVDDDETDDPRHSLTRERRMSERTLQMARHKIFTTMLRSTEDLEQSKISETETRSAAISRSLAALEGTSAPVRSSRTNDGRPSPRRTQSVEVGRDERSLPNVVEDLTESRPRTPISPLGEGEKRPMVRRRSTNGKVYQPKRSASPSPAAEGTAIPFPLSTDGPSPRTSLIRPSRPQLSSSDRPVRLARAVSEINVRDTADTRGTISTPGKRHESLSPEARPKLSNVRGSVSSSAITGSSTRQTLIFEEAGKPSVSYQLGNCIGRGQFGSVYRALNLSNGQMAAVKRIQLQGLKEDQVTDVMREVDLLQSLSHPSIVKYQGMSRYGDYLNIVMEYVENGSLGQTLKAFGRFNEQLAASYATKILEGLHYLHSQQVVHCDLKAANILSTKNGNIKLSDFGVSLNMKAVENIKNDAETFSRTGKPVPVKDVAGTPHWMAPEVIQLAGALPVSDIWSLGCTIIELLTGKPPYADISNSMTVLFRIVEDDMPPLPDDVSEDVVDFLRQCFVKDPKHRPSAAMLFEHPWLKRGWGREIPGLRPQDSIPFLRRVSQDLQRVDSTRLFSPEAPSPYDGLRRNASTKELSAYAPSSAVTGAEVSAAHRLASNKSHRFLKTTFSKAIICRLCSQPAKRSCVLCQDCGLICHAACANEYPSKCDQLAQLLAYAQQSGHYDLGELALSRASHMAPEVGPQSLPVTSELLSTSPPAHFQQKFLHGFRKTKVASASTRTSVDLAPAARAEAQRSRSSLGSGQRSLASRLSIASSDTGSGSAKALSSALGAGIQQSEREAIESSAFSPMPILSPTTTTTTTSRSGIPASRAETHRKSQSKDCVIM